MIVIDSHILVWWLGQPEKLSKKAKQAIEKAKKEYNIFISSISILEIYTLIKKGKLELDMLSASWLSEIEKLPYVKFIPMDNRIAVAAVELVDLPDKDPADRIIIATALNMGAQLVTSDREIRNYGKVQTIW